MCSTLRERIGGRIAMMRFCAGFAVALALALPGWAQRPAGQSGGTGYSGGGGHAGGAVHGGGTTFGRGQGGYSGRTAAPNYNGAPSYSGLVGLQAPSSFSQPGLQPVPGRLQPPPRAGVPLPYRGNGFSGGYRHEPNDRGRNPHRGRYRGHDHEGRNRGRGSYGYAPGYVYAYPYVTDQGFYDWGATDYSENEQGPDAEAAADQGPENGYGPEAPNPEEPYEARGNVPYPQQQQYAQPGPASAPIGPQRQEYHFAASSTSAPSPVASKPLTVIFKGGRTPEKMQNYMVTSPALTNLDGEHFEKIPLDQIDVAATQHANRSSGIDFQVPTASRD